MRVLHLSTHDTRGGAALSAWRLHEGLRQSGVDSRMLVRTKHSDSEHVVEAGDAAVVAAWHEQIATPWLQRRMPPDSAWFTVGCVDSFIDQHPWIAEADVLHLHWVAEWLSAAAVARLAALGKPLLWTFHDVWPMSCGVHFAGSNMPADDAWQTGTALPEPISSIAMREFQRKHGLLAPLPIQAIAPSQWLGNLIRSSHIGAGWKAHVIPYGIDTQTFAPGDAAGLRERLGLPAQALLLLFGCQAIGERRKGYPELVEALHLAAKRDPAVCAAFDSGAVQLLLFGADTPAASEVPLPMIHLGFVRGEAAMADLYRAADAYLCPSLEDNLPNTVLESLACGTPVLGFATGGVPDVVKHEHNGLLANCGDAGELATALTRFITDAALREHLQQTTRHADKAVLALKTQAQRVAEVYRSIIATALTGSMGEVPCASAPLPTLVTTEMEWLVQASAEAVTTARARESQLKDKLDKMRTKVAKAEPKPTAQAKPKRSWW